MGTYGNSVETPENIIRSRRRKRKGPNIDSWGTLHFETGFVFQNSCSLKFLNIHRKTSVLESLLNTFAGL